MAKFHAYRIAEDDFFLAFLDINPLREGHTLVIPKIETDRFFDLEEKYLSRILCVFETNCKSNRIVF